ncbi:Ivy family c-type lysozyme inhibitor [Dyella sp. C11]|uniref:Ivy family c-type lysozyme inhibitor n=1 Tax=Dyella sp. C11 TaxID=2126991 RepID=UPI000D646280|nr:Ivy family c-type lysozyme inhibitor [Dyella sp. C11]
MAYRFVVVLGIAAACVACSQQQEGSAPLANAPRAAATTSVPALVTTTSTPSNLTYLYDLMQRPDFSTAFAALSGVDQLPPWASQGGVATPAQQVTVNGRVEMLATACKPHDCPAERILILYDENTHAMSGLFARRKPNAANNADSNDPANDDLIWLGAPDEISRQLLRQKLYSPD